MNRRPATTLIEVLVAIFIMGIGMLALLTLFPLGALSMAQAIRDDRIASAAAQAGALADAWNIRNNSAVRTAFASPPAGPPAGVQPDPFGPGYPVYVDPVYVALGQTTLGASTTLNTPGMTRCSLNADPDFPISVATP